MRPRDFCSPVSKQRKLLGLFALARAAIVEIEPTAHLGNTMIKICPARLQ